MKAIKVIFALILIAVIGAGIVGFFVDNATSKDLTDNLSAIPLPVNTTIEATTHKTGRLNTSALQFYGAVLLRSTQPYAKLKSYYKAKAPADLDYRILRLKDAKTDPEFKDLDPELRFSYHDEMPENYYILYSMTTTGKQPFPMMDYRSYFG